MNKLIALLFMIIFIPLCIFLIQRLLFKAESSYVLYTHEKEQAGLKRKQQEEYDMLLKKQAKQSRNSKTEIKTGKKAIGEYNLFLVFVKPTALNKSTITPLINILEASNEKSITSLYYINTFYKDQAKKYDIDNFNLKISFHGIYNLEGLEKVGDIGYIWGKDPFATVRLQDSFDQLLKNNNIKFDNQSVAVFLYFDDSFGESNPYAGDRFYEHKKFRSFANDNTGRAFINVYNFDPNFAETVTEILSHEVLHLFGATDKYEESESVTRICSERGRGNIDLKPIVPQQTADIMCMYIEKSNDKFVKALFSEDNLVINKFTAKEIGWIK